MPTRPHICKKVRAHSDSVPPTVIKEDIPFPASTALDDLELLQPLNRNRVDFAKAQLAESVAKRTNQLYIV